MCAKKAPLVYAAGAIGPGCVMGARAHVRHGCKDLLSAMLRDEYLSNSRSWLQSSCAQRHVARRSAPPV